MFPPLENLKFWAGAGLVALVLSSSHLLDGPSDVEAAQATEASLNDALEQAQAERPELWSDPVRVKPRPSGRGRKARSPSGLLWAPPINQQP